MSYWLIAAYVLIGVGVSITAWAVEYHDHMNDPTLASFGLFISIVLGLVWPLTLALVPFGAVFYGIGKLIVAGKEK